MIFYNEDAMYVAMSLELNEDFFKHKIYGTLYNELEKIRKIYEFYKCPNSFNPKDDDRCMNTIKSMIYILHKQFDMIKSISLAKL